MIVRRDAFYFQKPSSTEDGEKNLDKYLGAESSNQYKVRSKKYARAISRVQASYTRQSYSFFLGLTSSVSLKPWIKQIAIKNRTFSQGFSVVYTNY